LAAWNHSRPDDRAIALAFIVRQSFQRSEVHWGPC